MSETLLGTISHCKIPLQDFEASVASTKTTESNFYFVGGAERPQSVGDTSVSQCKFPDDEYVPKTCGNIKLRTAGSDFMTVIVKDPNACLLLGGTPGG